MQEQAPLGQCVHCFLGNERPTRTQYTVLRVASMADWRLALNDASVASDADEIVCAFNDATPTACAPLPSVVASEAR